MNLRIVSFADVGKIERERVLLKATANINIGAYTALCSESTEAGSASSGLQVAYWFPNDGLKEGDLAVLYTKKGTESTKDIGNGHTAYFYYWCLTKPVWKKSENVLVLIESDEWTFGWPGETVAPEEPKNNSQDAEGGLP
jgi:hypothetical protein